MSFEMKIRGWAVAGSLGALAAMTAFPALAADPFEDDCDGCFYVNIEPLYMRSTSSEADVIWLTDDIADTPGQPGDDPWVENTGGFHLDNAWGARGTLGWQFADTWSIEFVGTYLQDWKDDIAFDAATDGGSLALPFQSAFTGIEDSVFTDIDSLTAERQMKFRSYELNLVKKAAKYANVILGLRRIDFDDAMVINTARDTDVGLYSIKGENSAWGIQLGADAVFPFAERFAIGGFVKTAWFKNSIDVTNIIVDGEAAMAAGSIAARNVKDTDNRTAYLADAAVFLSWAITDNIVTSLGYQLMAISGMAKAPENLEFRTLDFSDPTARPIKPKRNGFQFINGVNLRVKIRG